MAGGAEAGGAEAGGAEAGGAEAGGAVGEADSEAAVPPPYLATDPLTGRQVRLPGHRATDVFEAHFSSGERAFARRRNEPLPALRWLLRVRLGVWSAIVACLVALVAVLHVVGAELVFTTVVTLGCLGLAGVTLLVAWDAARLRATWGAAAVTWSAGAREGAMGRNKVESGDSIELDGSNVEPTRRWRDLASDTPVAGFGEFR